MVSKEKQTVKTNIGEIPIDDYREIVAMQNGFDSYADMRKQGYMLGNEYDDTTNDSEGDLHEDKVVLSAVKQG